MVKKRKKRKRKKSNFENRDPLTYHLYSYPGDKEEPEDKANRIIGIVIITLIIIFVFSAVFFG